VSGSALSVSPSLLGVRQQRILASPLLRLSSRACCFLLAPTTFRAHLRAIWRTFLPPLDLLYVFLPFLSCRNPSRPLSRYRRALRQRTSDPLTLSHPSYTTARRLLRAPPSFVALFSSSNFSKPFSAHLRPLPPSFNTSFDEANGPLTLLPHSFLPGRPASSFR
jgi:hypothetical protein